MQEPISAPEEFNQWLDKQQLSLRDVMNMYAYLTIRARQVVTMHDLKIYLMHYLNEIEDQIQDGRIHHVDAEGNTIPVPVVENPLSKYIGKDAPDHLPDDWSDDATGE